MQGNRQFVESVDDLAPRAEGIVPCRVALPLLGPDDFEVLIQRPGPIKIESQGRVLQDSQAFVDDPVISSLAGQIGLGIGFQRQGHDQASVGRGHGQGLGRFENVRSNGQKDENEKSLRKGRAKGFHGPGLPTGSLFYLKPAPRF